MCEKELARQMRLRESYQRFVMTNQTWSTGFGILEMNPCYNVARVIQILFETSWVDRRSIYFDFIIDGFTNHIFPTSIIGVIQNYYQDIGIINMIPSHVFKKSIHKDLIITSHRKISTWQQYVPSSVVVCALPAPPSVRCSHWDRVILDVPMDFPYSMNVHGEFIWAIDHVEATAVFCSIMIHALSVNTMVELVDTNIYHTIAYPFEMWFFENLECTSACDILSARECIKYNDWPKLYTLLDNEQPFFDQNIISNFLESERPIRLQRDIEWSNFVIQDCMIQKRFEEDRRLSAAFEYANECQDASTIIIFCNVPNANTEVKLLHPQTTLVHNVSNCPFECDELLFVGVLHSKSILKELVMRLRPLKTQVFTYERLEGPRWNQVKKDTTTFATFEQCTKSVCEFIDSAYAPDSILLLTHPSRITRWSYLIRKHTNKLTHTNCVNGTGYVNDTNYVTGTNRVNFVYVKNEVVDKPWTIVIFDVPCEPCPVRAQFVWDVRLESPTPSLQIAVKTDSRLVQARMRIQSYAEPKCRVLIFSNQPNGVIQNSLRGIRFVRCTKRSFDSRKMDVFVSTNIEYMPMNIHELIICCPISQFERETLQFHTGAIKTIEFFNTVSYTRKHGKLSQEAR